METFQFRNYEIKFVRKGSGSPIVFLHNGGTSHAIWKEVIPRLADSHTCYALDLLGYGASSKSADDYSLETYVEILGAFIDHHQLAPVTLVGNCMGSAMSILYAQRNPGNVRSLILVNPLTYRTFVHGRLGSFLRLRRSAPGFSRAIYRTIGGFKLNRLVSEQSLRMQFGAIGRQKHLEKSDDLCACFTGEGQFNSLLGALDDLVHYDQFDTLAKAPGFPPVCSIWGLENQILSARAGEELNETLQPVRAERLDGCGHLAMLEKPDEVARIIREFTVEANP